jgi:hypothetical protein
VHAGRGALLAVRLQRTLQSRHYLARTELEKRGHHFVRYADDCNIYVRSQRAGQRVMAGIEQFLAKRLKLKVNKGSVDILIEALFQAVLSEEYKPLSVRHRQVKDRILEAEGAIKLWTKPKLSDPKNERVLLEFENDFASA